MQEAAPSFSHLFLPGKLGKLVTKNRVKYAACSISNFNTREGFVSERELGRMRIISRCGAGIITNQGVDPDPTGAGKGYFRMLSLADDRYIPGLAQIADLTHDAGAIAIQQISHSGRYGGIDIGYCVQPSPVPQTLRHFRPPKELTKDEIKLLIEWHVRAAERAIKAGFDGIELTCFQGYLIANFLSPFTNRRTDEYGGSLENRCRFLLEVIAGIRDAIGERPLIVRLNGEELMDEFGGNTLEDNLEIVKTVAGAGVDMISLVIGWQEARKGALGRDRDPTAWLYVAERARRALTDAGLSVPLAFGPRLKQPELADKAMADGIIDFWEPCRPFLADPEMLHKIREGRHKDIRPCVSGLICLARMFSDLPYLCAVNPRLGHEYDSAYDMQPAQVPKRILVAGGGPAGMEFARVAGQRGHVVVLCEKGGQLGGQLRLATTEPNTYRDFDQLLEWYERQLLILGVEVRLGIPVTPDLVRREDPDVVVLATGAEVKPWSWNGRRPIFTFDQVLSQRIPLSQLGEKVVVSSGERAGIYTAESLAGRHGKQVVIVEEGSGIGTDVARTYRWRHRAWLQEYGVQVLTDAKIEGEGENGFVIETGGQRQELLADSLIVAGPRQSRQDLLLALEWMADELYMIGDAVKPRNLHQAIHEGYKLSVRV
jgi:2,4-dienoyl-CoA reductase (NADPH2)